LLVIIAFSFSKYVLPHYIYVIFPLAAIITGSVIYEILGKIRVLTRTIVWIQAVCVGVTFIAGFLILTVVFPSHSIFLWTAYGAALLLSLLFMRVTGSFEIRLIVPSVIAIVGFNLILNAHFYPELIKYQSDIRAAEVISKGTIPRERIYAFNIIRYSFEYKTGKYELPVRDTSTLSRLIREKNVWIFTDRANIGVVRSIDPNPVEEYEFDDYPVTRLKGKFLNATTRSQAVSKAYLLRY
jgi:4-amino-4-deoxy-L-arabinose transferase-like glycosyltransferase